MIIPTLLGITFKFQQMTDIRMYSLAALLIIIEFYYLLLFNYHQKISYLIIALIFASLASYTHYYSAIIAGLLILLYFLKYCIKYDIKNSVKLSLTGINFALLFIPWMNTVFNQMRNPYTYWMSKLYMSKEIIIYIACISIFLYPIYIYYKKENNKIFNEQIIIIISILLFIFIIAIIYGIISHPIFVFRYMYPMLLIYEFIGINVIINLIKKYHCKKSHICYFALIFMMLLLNTIISFIYQIPNYNIPSIQAINNYKFWNQNNIQKVYITNNNVPLDRKYSIPNFENLMYSDNKKRFFIDSSLMKTVYSENNFAYKKAFDDISHKINIINKY